MCDAKMILLNYETCFDKLPGGAICDMLNVFFSHFPELIELFVHNLFYFHRALNYSETLKYFTANSRDLEAVRRVFDEFLSLGDERGGRILQIGRGDSWCGKGAFNSVQRGSFKFTAAAEMFL